MTLHSLEGSLSVPTAQLPHLVAALVAHWELDAARIPTRTEATTWDTVFAALEQELAAEDEDEPHWTFAFRDGPVAHIALELANPQRWQRDYEGDLRVFTQFATAGVIHCVSAHADGPFASLYWMEHGELQEMRGATYYGPGIGMALVDSHRVLVAVQETVPAELLERVQEHLKVDIRQLLSSLNAIITYNQL